MASVFISDAVARSGFFDLFLVACVMFYVASRLIRLLWEPREANTFKTVLAWTFYIFGTILLAASLSRLPGDKRERQQPHIQQHQVPQAESVPVPQRQMPADQEQHRE